VRVAVLSGGRFAFCGFHLSGRTHQGIVLKAAKSYPRKPEESRKITSFNNMPAEKDDFLEWRDRNGEGFVLNEPRKEPFKLHLPSISNTQLGENVIDVSLNSGLGDDYRSAISMLERPSSGKS
jgi:hypothetical protein